MEIVTEALIDPGRVYEMISKQTAGSVVLHFAVVRGKTGDQVTTSIRFERAGDIESEMKAIADDIRRQWQVEDILIIRRIGSLGVGEIMALVAASAPHREEAFDACRFGVESLKKMRTVKKTER